MHPTKFLDRRQHRRQLVGAGRTSGAGERKAVFQGEKFIAAGLLILDGKTHEIQRRLALLPIHRQERHAVTAMDLQRE
jgi:hypothetical protein